MTTAATVFFDTNALLFAFMGGARVGKAASAALADLDQRRFVSAASLYEIGWKHRAGKLEVTAADVARTARASGLRWRAVDAATMMRAASLDWDHKDPFDRMIAAAALEADAALVSSDAAFDRAPGLKRIWA